LSTILLLDGTGSDTLPRCWLPLHDEEYWSKTDQIAVSAQ